MSANNTITPRESLAAQMQMAFGAGIVLLGGGIGLLSGGSYVQGTQLEELAGMVSGLSATQKEDLKIALCGNDAGMVSVENMGHQAAYQSCVDDFNNKTAGGGLLLRGMAQEHYYDAKRGLAGGALTVLIGAGIGVSGFRRKKGMTVRA